ncbi:unnamed protein product, partial [marine sediment metagenome]
FYGDWWDEAAKYRSGGFDRIAAVVPGCPTTAEIKAGGIKGTVFVQQLLEVRPGTQVEYLAAVAAERAPLLAERGIHLTHLLEVINNPTEIIVVWATDLPKWVELRKDFDTTRGLDDSGTPDPRLTEWQSVENRYVTGGHTRLMTPRPGSVYGPESWDEA